MDARLNKFNSFSSHPWFSRIFSKLKTDDVNFAVRFISENSSLEKGQFEMAVNRMFIGKEKPKRWKEIMELLTCCNS